MLKFWKNKSRLGFGSKSQQQSSSANASKGKSETISIKTGERIVWIGEDGPEYGTVKWIGYLPDKGKKPLAGIEFDKPATDGGIVYRNDDLFQAKTSHSALLPLDKLIKEKEFALNSTSGTPCGIVTSKPKKKWLQELLHPTANKHHRSLNQQNKKEPIVYQSKEQLQTEEKEECIPKNESETIEHIPQDYVYEPLNVTNTKAATTNTLRTSIAPTTLKSPTSTDSIANNFVQSESAVQPELELLTKPSTVKVGLTEVSSCEPAFLNSNDAKPLVRKSSLHGANSSALSYSAAIKQGIPPTDDYSHVKSLTERSKFFESLEPLNSSEGTANRSSRYPQPLTKPEQLTSQQHELACTNVISGLTSQFEDISIKDFNYHALSQNKTGTNKIRHPSPSAVRRRSSSAQEASVTGHSKLHHASDRVVKSEPRITTSSSESLSKPPYSSLLQIGDKPNADFESSYLFRTSKSNQEPDLREVSKFSRKESGSDAFGTNQDKLDFYSRKGKSGHSKKEYLPSPSDHHVNTSEFRLGDELQNSYEYSDHLRTPTETDYVTPSPEAGNGFNFPEMPKLGSALSSCSSESPEPETVDFEVGSVVEVIVNEEPHYGVIRWLGQVPGKNKLVAGIEMEEESDFCTNGNLGDVQYFKCPDRKGFFTFLSRCHKDGRFLESLNVNREGPCNAKFGSIDCPIVSGDIPPLSYCDQILQIFGKNRGIQGHHNSCYLDATLFSMFSFTSVFDNLLLRPPVDNDIFEYKEVQRVLKEEIVNPLRQNFYVRADRVMKLRTLLEKLSSVTGLTSEEKDPEEFLNSLLHQILRAEPFLKLSSGQETYFYQLFVEKNENIKVPTVQQLFDQSFLTSDIKLKEIPSCLIIQMPRFGKQFKMYPKIFPSQILDITDVLEDSPRQCDVCGELAEYECRDCFYQVPQELMKAYCRKCNARVHSHQQRGGHGPRKISVPENFNTQSTVPRVFMDLFAVVCIETSHYVAFVKCGHGPDAPWCFFDSMADRKGEKYGYNIPEVVSCPELLSWLSSQGQEDLEELEFYDKQMPELAKRLFSDAYMCMYQSSDVMMYR